MSSLRVVPPVKLDRLMDRVAAEVRAHMARMQVNQTQIAAVLGIPQSGVSARLRGKVPFRVDELDKLGTALGVDPVVFLGGRPDNPQPPGAPTGRYLGKTHAKRNGRLADAVNQ